MVFYILPFIGGLFVLIGMYKLGGAIAGMRGNGRPLNIETRVRFRLGIVFVAVGIALLTAYLLT